MGTKREVLASFIEELQSNATSINNVSKAAVKAETSFEFALIQFGRKADLAEIRTNWDRMNRQDQWALFTTANDLLKVAHQLLQTRKTQFESTALLGAYGMRLASAESVASRAGSGGTAKVQKNAKAAAIATAKREVKLLWLQRERGKRRKMQTELQFALECVDRFDAINSVETVKFWSKKWRLEAKTANGLRKR